MIPVKQIGFISRAKEIYVDPSGDDINNDGTFSKPYKTLEKAASVATAGYTIIVGAGTYIVTTTSSAGLAVDGVNYYFMPGSIITKETSGDLFNTTGFINNCNIIGYGVFSLSGIAGYIYLSATTERVIFECFQATNTVNSCLKLTAGTDVYIKAYKISSITTTGSSTIYMAGITGTIDVKIEQLICTNTLTGNDARCLQLEFDSSVNSSDAININFKIDSCISNKSISIDAINLNKATFNINFATGYNIIGATYITINGNGNEGIFTTVSNLFLNGNFPSLTTACTYAKIYGDVMTQLTASANNAPSFIEVHGLVKNLNMSDIAATDLRAYIIAANSFSVYYGIVEIESLIAEEVPLTSNIVTGNGKVKCKIFNQFNKIEVGGGAINGSSSFLYIDAKNAQYKGLGEAIHLQEGTLSIKGEIKNNSNFDITNNVIYWEGGTLILDGCVLITANFNCYPILCTKSAPQNLRITTQGAMAYGPLGVLLGGRKRKDKYMINVLSSLGLTINNVYTISEDDTVTYDTKAKLAQRIVSLINATVPLTEVIATQDTVGIDEYFYLESGTIGVDFVITDIINLIQQTLVYNSQTINEILGGPIIESFSLI